MARRKKVVEKKTEENDVSFGQSAPTSTIEAVLISAGLVLLVLLLYTLEKLISPFLIFGTIIFLLYPLRENPVVKNI